MSPDRPERLTVDDDLFLRMEHALGVPVVNQAIWRLPGRIDPGEFAALGRTLSCGRLARLVDRTPFPQRDRWIHTRAAGAHEFCEKAIAAHEIPAWARRQAEVGVDAVVGPAWRLTAVYVDDTGETAVSWVNSHVTADGGAVITGIEEAVAGETFDVTDARAGVGDTVREGARTLLCAADAARRLLMSRPATLTRPPAPPVEPVPAIGQPGVPSPSPSVVVTVDESEFDSAATAVGGTANTLFTALVIGVLEATGRVADGDEIPIGLPVSTRTPGDRRANATTGATALYRLSAARRRDLRPLRAASKAAFAAVSDEPGALELLGRIAQPLGDTIVRRLATDARAPLCLASNLGTLGGAFAGLGFRRPGPVAMRSMTLGATTEALRRMDGGISGWSSRSAGVVTLCLTALDPVRVPDEPTLSGLVAEELERWRLPATLWGA
ncbi:MAG: hypothetical protein INR66_12805 [Gordonia polyisoprenivorans]|nr:hypothetical protein [Gordonia polyisoprenivorans]